jgi:PAS domain S-box-containing protein
MHQEEFEVSTTQSNVTRFEHLGIKDGLSQSTVRGILQDSQGFMWFCTQYGLNRYDAHRFTVYRNDPSDPTSISDSRATCIIEDSQDDLWVGTRLGLNRFDKRTQRFSRFPLPETDTQHSRDYAISAILEDSQGTLWIGTETSGLYRFDRETESFSHLGRHKGDPDGLSIDFITAIFEDSKGTLWIGTLGGGLGRFDRQTERFTWHRHDEKNPHSLSSDNVTTVCEDSRGTLWVGTENGGLSALAAGNKAVRFVRYQNDEAVPHSLSNDSVRAILEDSAGTLWVGTDAGLNQFDARTQQFHRYVHNPQVATSLSHNEVFAIAEDAQGLLWIGTRLGLNKFDKTTRAFGHVKKRPDLPKGLSSDLVTAFLEDSQGSLWIGTYGAGLNKSTTPGNLADFVHFQHDENDPGSLGDIHALSDAETPKGVGDNIVSAIFEDSQGRGWFGTTAGLHQLVPGEGPGAAPTFLRYRHDKDDPYSLSHNLVLTIAEDIHGDLWIGTYRGLNKVDPSEDAPRFIRYRHDEDDPQSLSDDLVRTIFVDSGGEMWIGTSGGLNRLVHGAATAFVRYQHDANDAHSLSDNTITSIVEDEGGNLWIGTFRGLNRFDPHTGRFRAYRETDGLSSDFVDAVQLDDQGCLWVSTAKDINRFDPIAETFTHFDTYDGVQSDEFTIGVSYKDKAGKIYFAGTNGFNVFYPTDITENRFLPPVVLTGFLLANTPVPITESGPLRQSLQHTERIELDPTDYIFSFEFSALNYRQSHKNRFAYKLEGFDLDWIYTDASDRKATYTNVPPGTYTFRVKAANDDGLWNEEGTSIQITVTEPVWRLLLKSAFEGVVIHDQGNILEVNQAVEYLFGYERDELIGQGVDMLVPRREGEQFAELAGLRDEPPHELMGLRRDGSTFPVEVRSRSIDYQGRCVQVAAISDITERVRMEESLRESQRFLQSVIDALAANIAILNETGEILAVNASWRRFADENGLEWEDHGIGRNYLQALKAAAGDDAQSAHASARGIEEVIAGKREQFSLEYPCHSPWEKRWYTMQVTRAETKTGIHAAIAHRDITRRIEAQAALQDSELKFRSLIEQSSEGILLLDEEGCVIEWNRALEELTGLEREEVVGKSAWDIQFQLLTEEHKAPGMVERFRETMTAALRTGQAPWLDQRLEAVYRHSDGTERSVEQRLFPIKTDQGFRIGGIHTDITARKAEEAELRQLSRAVEQSASGIFITDLDGTIQFVNPAFTRITGYTADEAIGENPRFLKSGKTPREVYERFWATITQGGVWEGEWLNKRKNGELYWESAVISPVKDEAGSTTHFVAIKEDITQRKQAEDTLNLQIRYQTALAECTRTLLAPADTEAERQQILGEALQHLQQGAQVSRVGLFQNVEDPELGPCALYVAEACAPGIPPRMEEMGGQRLPWSINPAEQRRTLAAGEPWGGLTTEIFAAAPELLVDNDTLSIKFFPIHFEEFWWGTIAFADCVHERVWDEGELVLLRTAAAVMSSALQRWEAATALQEAHDRLESRVKERTAELNEIVHLLRAEVAERERAEAETQKRLVVEQRLAAISTHLMQAADIDEAIAHSLAEIGEFTDAQRVFLFFFQNNRSTAGSTHEWCAAGKDAIFGDLENVSLDKDSWFSHALRGTGGRYVEDVSRFPEEIRVRILQSGQDAAGAQYALPLYGGNDIIGFLSCHGLAKGDPEFEQNLQALEVIAGMLGNAWQREHVLATLEERVAARTFELSAFFDLATLASGPRDLSETLEPAVARILELGYCHTICVHLLSEDRSTLELVAQRNLPDTAHWALQEIRVQNAFVQRLNRPSDPLMTTDLAAANELPAQLRLAGFHTYLGAPLRTAGQPQGWISFYRISAQGFALDEISLLVALAEQVGVIVENYRLRQRIGEIAVLEERQRLARDLHDSVTQTLYGLTLFARSGRDAAEEGDAVRLSESLGELEANSLQALREMRLLLYELLPLALEQEGLVQALHQRFNTVERRAGLAVSYQAEEGLDLPRPVERHLYHIAIEALNNTLKHSGATEVQVRLAFRGSQLLLEIVDNGRGFDPAHASGGLGFENMRERAQRLGGRLDVVSSPGAGTRVSASADLVTVGASS